MISLKTGRMKVANQPASSMMAESVGRFPSLICHLDATITPSIILSGGNVLEWRDVSPYGQRMHFRQTTAANQPGWGGATINGWTVPDWTGGTTSGDSPHMYCVANRIQPHVGGAAGSRFWQGWHGGTSGISGAAAGFTIFCVASHSSSATVVNGSIRLYGAGDDGHTTYVSNGVNSTYGTRIRPQVSGSSAYIVGTTVNTDQTRVYSHRYTVSNTTTELWVDGVSEGTSTQQRFWPNSGSPANYDHFALGSNGDAYRVNYNTPWRGAIGEFMFFDESLPDADRSQMEVALLAKWGL